MEKRKNLNDIFGDVSSQYYLSGDPLHPEDEPFFQNEQIVADRFVVKGLLGRGRRTQVFKMSDRISKQDIALKVFTHDTGCNYSTEEMLRQEILKGRKIKDHHHVIRSYDLHTVLTPWGKKIALSMEYADGGSLDKWLVSQKENHAARMREAPRILTAIAHGLAAIHNAGIFLIDLWLGNVLFVKGEIKIGDLMLAQTKDPDIINLEIDPAQRGAPNYLSPEQEFPNNFGPCDPRSDIYRFGIVAAQLFSRHGEIPKKGTKGLREVEPSELGMLTESVRNFIVRCMESDPMQRYQDGTELLAKLQEALQKPTCHNAAKDIPSGTSPSNSTNSPHDAPSQPPPPVPPKYRTEKFPKNSSCSSRTNTSSRQNPPKPTLGQKKTNSPHNDPSQSPPPVPPKYRTEKFPKNSSSRTNTSSRQNPPKPTLSPQKASPSAAPPNVISRGATEPQYLGIISDGIKREAAEVHVTLTTRIDELTLPDLCRFEVRAHFLPLPLALVQQLKDRIAVLERTVESLKRQGWQSIIRSDYSLALSFFDQAEAVQPNDRTLVRARQCLQLLIKRRKALIKEILMPDRKTDNDSHSPTLEVSEEYLVGYIGVLLGFEEESRWNL